jgi:hypothetical protein
MKVIQNPYLPFPGEGIAHSQPTVLPAERKINAIIKITQISGPYDPSPDSHTVPSL